MVAPRFEMKDIQNPFPEAAYSLAAKPTVAVLYSETLFYYMHILQIISIKVKAILFIRFYFFTNAASTCSIKPEGVNVPGIRKAKTEKAFSDSLAFRKAVIAMGRAHDRSCLTARIPVLCSAAERFLFHR